MKKSIILYYFSLLFISFSSCNQAPFYHEELQDIKYSYSAVELMSNFPSDSLTILINLDDIDLLQDILEKVRTDQPGLGAFDPKLNDIYLNSVNLTIEQTEESIIEELENKIENIELIMSNTSSSSERVLADYSQGNVRDNYLFLNCISLSNAETDDFIRESSSLTVAYHLRLTFSERPELEFLNISPTIWFDYKVIFAEEE